MVVTFCSMWHFPILEMATEAYDDPRACFKGFAEHFDRAMAGDELIEKMEDTTEKILKNDETSSRKNISRCHG